MVPCGWTRQQVGSDSETKLNESKAWSWFIERYPGVAERLQPFERELRQRQDQGEYWWELRACAYYRFLESPKIIYPDIAKGPRFYLDDSNLFLANTAYLLGTDDPFLLGTLNSRLAWFAIGNISIPFGTRAGKFRYRMIYQYMEHVPVPEADQKDQKSWKLRSEVAAKAMHMQGLLPKKEAAKTGHERNALLRQIEATDREIDRLVYALYGLSDDEIRIVEDATPR